MSHPLIELLSEVNAEVLRQRDLWGEQNHPDGTAIIGDAERSDRYRQFNAWLVETNNLSWRDILYEELLEVLAEEDPEKIREELIQVAAVAVSWAEAIDRRG